MADVLFIKAHGPDVKLVCCDYMCCGVPCRYYCNAQLGLTQWERPTAAGAAPPAAAAASAAAFIPAAAFEGAKPGYVFKQDASGLGYYRDVGPFAVNTAAGSTGIGAAAAVTAHLAAPAQRRPVVNAAPDVADDDEARGPRKSRQEQIAERQAARNAALARQGRSRAKERDELDPMDPVSWQMQMLICMSNISCRNARGIVGLQESEAGLTQRQSAAVFAEVAIDCATNH